MTSQQVFRNALIILLTLAGAYVLLMGYRIIIVLLVAIIIASAVLPAVNWLKGRGLSQGVSILIVYLGLAVGLFALAVIIVPPAVNQLAIYLTEEDRLANRIVTTQHWLERNLENLTASADVDLIDPESVRTAVNEFTGNIVAAFPTFASEVGALVADLILTIIMGVYWLTSRAQAIRYIETLFPLERRAAVLTIIDEVESTLGAYLRALATGMISVGALIAVLLFVLRVPNAIMLGVIVGVSTVFPIIGIFVGGLVAFGLAMLSSPLHAFATLAVFVLVALFDVRFLAPRTTARTLKSTQFCCWSSSSSASASGGIVGAVIALPITGTIIILMRHLVFRPMQEEAAPSVVQGGILLNDRDEDTPTEERRIYIP